MIDHFNICLQVYVYGNDIFYVRYPGDKNVFNQLTDTGSDDIFNGVPDWIYEGIKDMKSNSLIFVFLLDYFFRGNF